MATAPPTAIVAIVAVAAGAAGAAGRFGAAAARGGAGQWPHELTVGGDRRLVARDLPRTPRRRRNVGARRVASSSSSSCSTSATGTAAARGVVAAGWRGRRGVPGGCMTRSSSSYISALMASPPFQIQRSVAAPRHSVSAGICTSSVCRHLYVVMVKRSSGDGNVAAQERRGQPQALFGCRRRSTVWPAAALPRRPL